MLINNSKTVSQIKSEFNNRFPYLKIAFYTKKHKEGEGTDPIHEIAANLHLNSVRDSEHEGVINISPEMSTGELEQAFEDHFGMHIQIFRKSGDLWLQTTSTDEWSLSEQNKQALMQNQS